MVLLSAAQFVFCAGQNGCYPAHNSKFPAVVIGGTVFIQNSSLWIVIRRTFCAPGILGCVVIDGTIPIFSCGKRVVIYSTFAKRTARSLRLLFRAQFFFGRHFRPKQQSCYPQHNFPKNSKNPAEIFDLCCYRQHISRIFVVIYGTILVFWCCWNTQHISPESSRRRNPWMLLSTAQFRFKNSFLLIVIQRTFCSAGISQRNFFVPVGVVTGRTVSGTLRRVVIRGTIRFFFSGRCGVTGKRPLEKIFFAIVMDGTLLRNAQFSGYIRHSRVGILRTIQLLFST